MIFVSFNARLVSKDRAIRYVPHHIEHVELLSTCQVHLLEPLGRSTCLQCSMQELLKVPMDAASKLLVEGTSVLEVL